MKLLPFALALACTLPLAAQECPPDQPQQNQPQPDPNQPQANPDPGGRARPDTGDQSIHHDTDWSRPWLTDPDASEHRTPSEADDDLDALLFLAHDGEPSTSSEPGAWATTGSWFSGGALASLKDLGDSLREAFKDSPLLRELYEFWLRVVRKRIRRLRQKAKEAAAGDHSGGDTTTGGGGGGTTGGGDTELDSLLMLERLILDLLGGGDTTTGGGGTDPTLDEYLTLAKKLNAYGEKVKKYRDDNVTDPEEKKMYDGFLEDNEKASNELLAAAGQDFGDDAVQSWPGWEK